MAVRPLDPSSAEDVAAAHEIMRVCHAEANPEEPYRSLDETSGFLRHPPTSEQRLAWLAEHHGDRCGFALLGALGGSALGTVELLVRPDARREGHGRMLLAAVREQARELGRSLLTGAWTAEAGAAFAASVGAVDARRDVRSLLRLPCATAPPQAPGYTLRSWVGAAPEELVASYARAREAVNDAPLVAADEWERWDVDRVRDLERAVARRGRDVRVTVALDASGAVVAFTELRVSRARGATANTEDTAVVAAHRRRGLGRAVKLESLALLQRDRPDVPLVTTTNAESNDAMLSLNRTLGFRPVARATCCVLEL
jgi:GNAT superfamily N-acetyltransferase